MKRFLLCLAIAGCAQAGKENAIIGGLTDAGSSRHGDAGDVPEPDASLIDAPPAQVTLSQTTSGTIVDGNTFSCQSGGISAQNSYYRVFNLADFGVTTTLHVTAVDFAIEFADAGQTASGTLLTKQPATVRIGTYGATPSGTTLDPAQIRSINSVTIQIANGLGTRMTVPITGDVPPGSQLIATLDVPDGTANESAFVIGSNGQGERGAGYTSATDCGFTKPTTMKSIATSIGRGEADILLNVTGNR